ncbi:hypothetical protein Mucpa_6376 [Mucilaginibacter paludis DSM 18603]|uniref:Uncharacterized protein n=1 Tax=Mucilaginibacter paludis DSM 18603 TaxID=714943 RepID=H1Y7U4_9SPHI|nr:hypothetical protein Mucpa_6376 [Mucilaginibacter paludis DSM 18603]
MEILKPLPFNHVLYLKCIKKALPGGSDAELTTRQNHDKKQSCVYRPNWIN